MLSSYCCNRDNSSQPWRESFSDREQCHQSEMDFLPSASWGFTYLPLKPEPPNNLHGALFTFSNPRWTSFLILLQLFQIPFQERLRLLDAYTSVHDWRIHLKLGQCMRSDPLQAHTVSPPILLQQHNWSLVWHPASLSYHHPSIHPAGRKTSHGDGPKTKSQIWDLLIKQDTHISSILTLISGSCYLLAGSVFWAHCRNGGRVPSKRAESDKIVNVWGVICPLQNVTEPWESGSGG